MSRAVAYVINGRWDPTGKTYPEYLRQSLRGLLRFVDPGDVHVYLFPPLPLGFELTPEAQGINIYEKKKDHPVRHPFAFKLYPLETDADDLIAMDADTIVYRNPFELLEGDFLVAARPDPCNRYPLGPLKRHIFIRNFEALNLEPLPLLGDGFTVFKSRIHEKIRRDWKRYMKMYVAKDLELPMLYRYVGMLSFTLAVSRNVDKSEILFLGPEEFGLERYDGRTGRPYAMDIQRLKK